jgi:HPt (histidine-containing phosphotransfer) domain-containing protein
MNNFLAKPINRDNIQKILIRHLGITNKGPAKATPAVREVSYTRFDIKGLIERMQVEESVLLDLASQAIDSLHTHMQTLKALIESDSREQVKKQAHLIKGVGLNLSFNQLAHMARHMEALATDDPSGMPDHYSKMAAEVAEIRELLR